MFDRFHSRSPVFTKFIQMVSNFERQNGVFFYKFVVSPNKLVNSGV
ncbi:hypothetical protein C2W64_02843 [Brevibacillus laterosporus]|nr:hypothetical protein C2W64_02843 [Brevibacillus laterosporus]